MRPCPIKKCKRSVPDHHPMCGRHWRLVPEDLMHAGKPGARKEYVSARDEAIAAVEHALKARSE